MHGMKWNVGWRDEKEKGSMGPCYTTCSLCVGFGGACKERVTSQPIFCISFTNKHTCPHACPSLLFFLSFSSAVTVR